MSTLIPTRIPIPENTESENTEPKNAESGNTESLRSAAAVAGVAVLAASAWPESADDVAAPALAGFVSSSFSPIAAEAARRCLERRPVPQPSANTAVIIVSALGDIAGARHVARAVDTSARISPLMFFQCVPNAVAGYIAARWRLTGPVVCLGGVRAAFDAAGLLLEDGDADDVLVIRVEQATGAPDRDRADAVLLAADATEHERGRT